MGKLDHLDRDFFKIKKKLKFQTACRVRDQEVRECHLCNERGFSYQQIKGGFWCCSVCRKEVSKTAEQTLREEITKLKRALEQKNKEARARPSIQELRAQVVDKTPIDKRFKY